MTCPNCNKPLADTARFCNGCGIPLQQAPPPSSQIAYPPHVHVPLPPRPVFTYPEQSPVTARRLAGALCLVLGLIHLVRHIFDFRIFHEYVESGSYAYEDLDFAYLWLRNSSVALAAGCVLLVVLAVLLLAGKSVPIPAFVVAGVLLVGVGMYWHGWDLMHSITGNNLWSMSLLFLPNVLIPLVVGVYELRLRARSQPIGPLPYPQI